MLFFLGGLKGAEVQDFLLRGVRDSLIGEGHDAEDEKYESS